MSYMKRYLEDMMEAWECEGRDAFTRAIREAFGEDMPDYWWMLDDDRAIDSLFETLSARYGEDPTDCLLHWEKYGPAYFRRIAGVCTLGDLAGDFTPCERWMVTS